MTIQKRIPVDGQAPGYFCQGNKKGVAKTGRTIKICFKMNVRTSRCITPVSGPPQSKKKQYHSVHPNTIFFRNFSGNNHRLNYLCTTLNCFFVYPQSTRSRQHRAQLKR